MFSCNNSSSCKPSDALLEFHASDIDTLGDRYEYRQAKNFLKRVKESSADNLFLKALDGIPFVLSFSTKRDYLPMWRLYADDGRGICLKFNTKLLIEACKNIELNKCNRCKMGYCEYTTPIWFNEKMKDLTAQYKKRGRWDGEMGLLDSLSELNMSAVLLKDSAFEPEQEWRTVFFDTNYCLMPRSNDFIAYKPIYIPVSCLEEIQSGPCANEIAKTGVQRWVEPINQSTSKFQINITKSTIPYRN